MESFHDFKFMDYFALIVSTECTDAIFGLLRGEVFCPFEFPKLIVSPSSLLLLSSDIY